MGPKGLATESSYRKLNESITRGKAIRQPAQWVAATALVMSGRWLARHIWWNVSQVSRRTCVAGVNLAVLVFTVAMLARGWWLAPSHGIWRGSAWKNRATYTLVASTILAFSLWGLRFAGKMGESPIRLMTLAKSVLYPF